MPIPWNRRMLSFCSVYLLMSMHSRNWTRVLSYSITICDSAPLKEALWGVCQNWENYLIAINTIFYTLWCKNDYSVTFLSTCLQRFGLSKIVTYVYFCGPIKQKCSKMPLSFQICTEKSVCHDCVWYDEYLGRIYLNEKFWPWFKIKLSPKSFM